jgi:hypothetical protein
MKRFPYGRRTATQGKGVFAVKRILVGVLAGLLVVGFTAPALAWGHGWGHGGGWHGGFWPGYAAGAFTGLAVGPLAAPLYFVPPAPVYVVQPPPACYTLRGYWSQVPVAQGGVFTTYQTVWVPGGTVCG